MESQSGRYNDELTILSFAGYNQLVVEGNPDILASMQITIWYIELALEEEEGYG